MNNLLSYCGLIDAKIRASVKDFPMSMQSDFVALKEQPRHNKNKELKELWLTGHVHFGW